MEKSATSEILGCGSGQTSEITLNIQTTTGGNFFITVEDKSTIEQLKKIVSKKLKVSKDRICLLHRERQLRNGTLKDNGLVEGSRVILLPSVETGLLTQRPENSVMQALESLNDSQVNDFLSGKSPLNLTMRLGDHMMLIQLQLSTLNPGNSNNSSTSSTKSRNNAASTKIGSSTSSIVNSKEQSVSKDTLPKSPINIHYKNNQESNSSQSSEDKAKHENCESDQSSSEGSDLKSFLHKQDIQTLQNAFEIFKSLAEMQEDSSQETVKSKSTLKTNMDVENSDNTSLCCDDQSPIKSLSNLVSSPIKPHNKSNVPVASHTSQSFSKRSAQNDIPMDVATSEPTLLSTPQYVPLPSSIKNNLLECLVGNKSAKSDSECNLSSSSAVITDPIAANLTSCLCSTFNMDYPCTTNCHPSRAITNLDNNHCDTSNPNPEGPCTSHSQLSPLTSLPDSSSKNADCGKPNVQKSNCSVIQKLNKNRRLQYLFNRTSNPISQSKQKAIMQSFVNKHLKKKLQQSLNESKTSESKLSSTETNDTQTKDVEAVNSETMESSAGEGNDDILLGMPTSSSVNRTRQTRSVPANTMSDTKALIEASKNLTQTLKKLSKQVLNNKVDLSDEESARAKIGQGAVIESMKHHGKGIYSGTFSGTLNPALQDRFGRPKRDISTIIHILNDLLCATPPQYRRGARITFQPTHTTHVSKNKQREQLKESGEEQEEEIECGCNKCNKSTCPYGECNGHPPPLKSCLCQELCHCSKSSTTPEHSMQRRKCMGCSDKDIHKKDKRISNKNCKKCNLASALALENSKTKCKLDQLRLVMQQKKQRREERKMKAAPYVTNTSNVSQLQTDNTNSVLAEEINTLA